MFSVVMPSYLGEYKHAAKDRDKKIVRAIDSVLAQTYEDYELIVIADGCEKTVEILQANYTGKDKVRGFLIDKQPLFSGNVRNAGLKVAEGDWVVYLDIDDMFGTKHLEIIANGIKQKPGYDWYWFNDRSYDRKSDGFNEHQVDVERKGRNGTSNICHRNDLGVYWPDKGTYLHDWLFINKLKAIGRKYVKIPTPEYLICHVPHLLDY